MLLSIKHDVRLALVRGEATSVVLLDQLAAFGTIDHGTRLDCLSSWFGVGGIVLEWFKSYLSDHLQCVKIVSNCLMFGVLQGSVLYSFPCIILPSAKSFEIIPAQVSTVMQMIHSYMFISHISMWFMPLTG